MVELSHAFGLKVIAEWVETEADANTLAAMGVDCLQGNLFGEASIIAPWAAANGANFELVPASLAPVEASYFEPVVQDISEPNENMLNDTKSTLVADAPGSARLSVDQQNQKKSVEVAELDDATLMPKSQP